VSRQLEEALLHAGEANDIESLKALARQEAASAGRWLALLAAVVRAQGGVVTLGTADVRMVDRSFSFVVCNQDKTVTLRSDARLGPEDVGQPFNVARVTP
jgi:hypothetical protein